MLEILGSDAFLGSLRDAAASGESVLFRGKIEVSGTQARCYIKPFATSIRLADGHIAENRSVVSEALGYFLAKSCGFEVANRAGAIILHRDQLPIGVLTQLARQHPTGQAQDEYLAWFSEDMRLDPLIAECPSDAPELMQQRNRSRIASELSENKASPRIASFDQWLENSDRHLGNLLGSPSGRLFLIDHGRLFRTPTWKPGSLESSPLPLRNALMDLIDSFIPNWSERSPTRSARILAYKAFSVAWQKEGRGIAGVVLSEFMDPPEVEQVLEFLTSRLDPGQYSAEVGLMI
ncbi:hypothetical protein D3C76_274230 [compost metagenome]